MTESDRALAASDAALLAALREHVEHRNEAISDPDGDRMDEMEVEGLAVLAAEWIDKADRPDPAIQKERAAIRVRIDAFREAAQKAGVHL